MARSARMRHVIWPEFYRTLIERAGRSLTEKKPSKHPRDSGACSEAWEAEQHPDYSEILLYAAGTVETGLLGQFISAGRPTTTQ